MLPKGVDKFLISGKVSVVPQRTLLEGKNFPSTVEMAAKGLAEALEELRKRGFEYQGHYNQYVGADLHPMLVFNPIAKKATNRTT